MKIFLPTLLALFTTFSAWKISESDNAFQKRNPGQNIQNPAGTIILSASSFFDEIPKGHYVTDAETLKVPWLFNNTGLVMSTRSNYVIKINVPETGTYYLFARSQ